MIDIAGIVRLIFRKSGPRRAEADAISGQVDIARTEVRINLQRHRLAAQVLEDTLAQLHPVKGAARHE